MAQKCVMVPETTCELVEYTKCDWNENPVPARDDKVSPSSSSSS